VRWDGVTEIDDPERERTPAAEKLTNHVTYQQIGRKPIRSYRW
jgi:hypothetical protein